MGIGAQGQSENTLLWRISGKNLTKPSYLFGTIHMLCADDIQLSDSLRSAIGRADRVYLELDMDNLFEMVGAMKHMKMRNDTTLADLLTKEDYNKVKAYFDEHSRMIPFSMIESYKPMLAASTLMEQSMRSESCQKMVAMEQLIMKEAKSAGKGIRGLETMAYQLSIFDSIPYRLQAQQLVKMIDEADKEDGKNEIEEMTRAYRSQELNKLEELTNQDDMGVSNFTELLLYNRNRAWVKKLDDLMPGHALLVAVGAGHLPGSQGVINLLRKAGYKVEPVKNEMIKRKTRDI
jgi:uncharacterized protein